MGELKGFLLQRFEIVTSVWHGWRHLREIVADPVEREFMDTRKEALKAAITLGSLAIAISINNPDPHDGEALRQAGVVVLIPSLLALPTFAWDCLRHGRSDLYRQERLRQLRSNRYEPD